MFAPTKNRTEIDISILRNVLLHDTKTGHLTWRNLEGRRRDRNGLRAGSVRKDGYWHVQFMSKKLLVHRICWALVVGEWPNMFLDHKNGNRADNRMANLREATYPENSQNREVRTGTKLCTKGVAPSGEKFWAYIAKDKKQVYLGTFPTIELAAAARACAEQKMFTHRRIL